MRVLILEDEPAILDTICMLLKERGYAVKGVKSHDRAIACAREFEPDVLLTGFHNACEENGCETAAEVLKFLPRCRVVLFSGSAAAAPVLEDFWQRGYRFDILPKPVHPDELRKRFAEYEASARASSVEEDR
jgi:DNA-binding NtrC family response regulator